MQAVADASCTTNTLTGFQADSEDCADTLLGESCQGYSKGAGSPAPFRTISA